eukprot:COSAG01_NODE_516_length_16026_cov_63.502857_14_plen_92_part_00
MVDSSRSASAAASVAQPSYRFWAAWKLPMCVSANDIFFLPLPVGARAWLASGTKRALSVTLASSRRAQTVSSAQGPHSAATCSCKAVSSSS